jgi:hypothetical protein
LLAQAGLNLYGFLNEAEWEPRGILTGAGIEELVEALSPEARYDLAEILRAPEYLLVCGHPRPSLPRAPRPADAESA